MEQGDKLRVLDKLRKLLAMAADGSGASVTEAETAARQAANLMKKYNLDTADLQFAQLNKDPTEDLTAEYTLKADTIGGIPSWQSMIAVACAKLFDAQADIVIGGEGEILRMLGFETDVLVASWLCVYLVRTVERARDREVKGKVARADFCQAAASTLAHRLNEMRKARDAEFAGASGGTALAVVNKKAAAIAAEFGAPNYIHTSYRPRDAAAYRAGQETGKAIHIPDGAITDKRPAQKSLA